MIILIYTVTFNPAIDYVISVNDLHTGQVNRTVCEKIYYGGKGINVSRVLHELGLKSEALGFIAGFTGKQLETVLNDCGIQTDFIELENGMTRINVKLESNEETEINANGPEINKKAIMKLEEKISQLKSGDYLIISGSIPNTTHDNIYEELINCVKGKNVKLIVDATGNLLLKTLKCKPFLIKPNKDELAEMFNAKIHSTEEVEYYALKLKQMGVRNVLVSLADEGAILICEEGNVYRKKAPKGEVKNSVGAGDSMLAGFVAGYIETLDYKRALDYAVAAGSATAFSDDLCKNDEIKKLMK